VTGSVGGRGDDDGVTTTEPVQQATPVQLDLDAMPIPLFACTPSRLTTWTDCPKHYRMKYLDRPRPQQGPPWAHNSLGAAVHTALARWWQLPRPARTPTAAGDVVEAVWSAEGFRDDAQSTGWRARARAMVERYLARVDPAVEPVGVERTVAMRTSRLALSGRIDRLDDRAGELVVVDYKTGRRPPTTDDARGSLALALYAAAAARTLRRPCRRVELHHVPSGEVVGWEHTDDALGRQLARSAEVADEIVAAGRDPGRTDNFPARPGAQCGWCSFRAHCAEGQAAAPARAAWDALADLDAG
jgi:RecB family exonuclease